MNSERSATAVCLRRMIVLCAFLFCAVADSSLFTLHAQHVQRGIASYYAHRWTGRRTASGERFHHDSLTCAHLKHPFGTILKVTSVDTDSTVFVRVNDRGPYHHRRIIDLSWAAAKKLGITSKGVAEVIVEVCQPVVHVEVPSVSVVIPKAPWDSLSNEPLLPWAP